MPVIGAADPNNVVEEIGRGSQSGIGGEQGFNVSGTNAVEILEQLKKQSGVGGGSGRRRKA